MATGDEHRANAAEALDVARTLRADHPEWATVPLFYSAMHLVHAWFDEQSLPVEQRHPEYHASHRSGGRVVAWGTTDVVAKWCPGHVSTAYKSLFNVGRVIRYSLAPRLRGGADQRFWDDHDTIATFVGPPPS